MMCRIQMCFDLEAIESQPPDFTDAHRAITGADKPDWMHNNYRQYPAARQLAIGLRQWSRNTQPVYIGSSAVDNALRNAGMLEMIELTPRQRQTLARGNKPTRRYQISIQGRQYLAWLEAREDDDNAAADALHYETFASVQSVRYQMAGAL